MTELSWLVFPGYAASFVGYFLHFELQRSDALVWARRLLVVSLLTHLAFLVAMGAAHPLSALPDFLFAISFVILAASFVLESRWKIGSLMLFALPVVMTATFLSMVVSKAGTAGTGKAASPWLWLHAGLTVAGFACLMLAVSASLMYLLQSRQLKSKHLGRAFLRLPSLGTLDRLHFGALTMGLALFSLGILMGLLWASQLRELGQAFRDVKVNLSFLTCLLYWVVLGFRLSSMRRGQKIAVGTLIIFALFFATILSSGYGPNVFHGGGG